VSSRTRFNVNKIPLVISSIALIIMMFVTVINVIGRMFFASPLYGGVELISLSGIFLIGFALSYTESVREHIVIEIMTRRLPIKLKLPFYIIATMITLGTLVLVTWGAYSLAWDAVVKPGSLTPVLHWASAPFKFSWVAGCIMVWCYFAYHLVQAVKQLLRKEGNK
jgi:TRAP-type C4-dicarboxylate transport system permease small subunit